MKFIYRVHALQRIFQRDISKEIVEETIKNGVIIEKYLDDKPYASFLVLGLDYDTPIHIVYAKNDDEFIIITAYYPDSEKWNKDYNKRIVK